MGYVTIYEEYNHKFFQLPKVLFTNDRYTSISIHARVAWALLCDRSSLSRKNKWFDKDTGRIYFVYKNKELMEILNIRSETTLTKIKKELRESNLIEEKRMGFNRPNKMYLLYPEITESDMYEIDNLENYEHDPIKDSKKEEKIVESYPQAQSQTGQGTPFFGAPKNGVPYPQKMEPNDTELSNTDFKDLDTLDTKDTKIESQKSIAENQLNEKARLKEEYMEKGFYENLEVIPERIAIMLQVFSDSPEQAKKYYDIILLAKRNAELACHVVIWLELEPELEQKIINTFSRSVRKIEKEGKIENKNGYIYKAIYDLICNKITDDKGIAVSNEKLNYNWLDE